jgi:hypothetical protein
VTSENSEPLLTLWGVDIDRLGERKKVLECDQLFDEDDGSVVEAFFGPEPEPDVRLDTEDVRVLELSPLRGVLDLNNLDSLHKI